MDAGLRSKIPVRSTASLPPFTERGRREWEHNVKADEAGDAASPDAPTACLPHGIPRLLASPYPIQIITVGNQMTWVHEVNRNQRYIYMRRIASREPEENLPRPFGRLAGTAIRS